MGGVVDITGEYQWRHDRRLAVVVDHPVEAHGVGPVGGLNFVEDHLGFGDAARVDRVRPQNDNLIGAQFIEFLQQLLPVVVLVGHAGLDQIARALGKVTIDRGGRDMYLAQYAARHGCRRTTEDEVDSLIVYGLHVVEEAPHGLAEQAGDGEGIDDILRGEGAAVAPGRTLNQVDAQGYVIDPIPGLAGYRHPTAIGPQEHEQRRFHQRTINAQGHAVCNPGIKVAGGRG